MKISDDIIYVGVNDHRIELFEGLYDVPNGMSYNSYVILDEKIAVVDTVEAQFSDGWINNIKNAVGLRKIDYLIIQHMEPDHSANIKYFLQKYPETVVVASSKAFEMMENFYGIKYQENWCQVSDGSVIELGRHKLVFFSAPMVHWPEVIVTYERAEEVLFSADAFGKFGALDNDDEWENEARRYYFGIIGKYGVQVQFLLSKLKNCHIKTICPLHGVVINTEVEKYINKYNVWSAYEPEVKGVMIAYTSVYGNTQKATALLEKKLVANGIKNVVRYNLIKADRSKMVSEAFRYSGLVLATTTYNAEMFPVMRDFINDLTERNYQNRTIGFMENGSWAIIAARLMRERFEKCKNINFLDNGVRIISSLKEENEQQIDMFSNELSKIIL